MSRLEKLKRQSIKEANIRILQEEEEFTDSIEIEELPVSDEGKYCVTDNLELKLIKTNQIVEGPPWWKFWKKKNKANNRTVNQKRKNT